METTNNTLTIITAELLRRLQEQAAQSTRGRVMHLFHQGDWEHMHRMINALSPNTYIQPHKHSNMYESEGFVILVGKVAVCTFTTEGQIEERIILEPNSKIIGVDVKPNTWHTIVALQNSAVYEVKGWPNEGYNKESAKEFAPWAPKEGTPESKEYLERIKKH